MPAVKTSLGQTELARSVLVGVGGARAGQVHVVVQQALRQLWQPLRPEGGHFHGLRQAAHGVSHDLPQAPAALLLLRQLRKNAQGIG